MLKQLVLRTEQDSGQRWIEGRRMVNEILRGGKKRKRKSHAPIEHVILFLTTTDWQREVWERWKTLPRGGVFSFLIHHKEVPDTTRFNPYSTQERVATKWGDIVPAQILLLQEGLQKFPSATNFTFVSGECVPLASPEAFYNNISGGSAMPYEMIPWKEFITSKHERPKDYAWYGHTWFSLNREHANIAVNAPTDYYRMKARPLPQMTHSLEPDEFGVHTHLLSEYEEQVKELLEQKKRNQKTRRSRLIYKRNPRGRKLYPPTFYNALERITGIQNVQITDFVQQVDNRGKPTQHPIKYDSINDELANIFKTSKKNGYLLFRKIKVEPNFTKQLVTLLVNIWEEI